MPRKRCPFFVGDEVSIEKAIDLFVYTEFPHHLWASWVWEDQSAGVFRLVNGANSYRAYRFAGVWRVVIHRHGE